MVRDISASGRASEVDSRVSPGDSFVPFIPEEDRYSTKWSEPAVSGELACRGEQLALLKKAVAGLASSSSTEDLAPMVSILGNLIPGAERCVVFLFDPVQRLLHPEVLVNLPPEFKPALSYNEQRTRLLTTTTERTNRPLVIYLPGNKQFSPLWRLAHREDIKTLWLIPWRDQDSSLLGAILFAFCQAYSPTKQALASVMLLTDWMSTALQRAGAQQDNGRPEAAFGSFSDAHRITTARDSSRQEQGKHIEPDAISMVSHELLSPLTLIKGYTATMLHLGESITDEQRKQYLRGIDSATGKLTRLLENFRDIGRLESGIPNLTVQSTSLPELLRKSISEIQSQTTRHIIKLRLSRPLPPLNVDRQKIEHLTTNLLLNAVKYSPQGGDIVVSAKQARDKEALREILGEALPMKLPCLVVTVTDPGVGIPQEDLERIFEKFCRVDNRLTRATSGAGLGLYICKIIVETHGGHIWARSRLGKGSTFSFSLPVD